VTLLDNLVDVINMLIATGALAKVDYLQQSVSVKRSFIRRKRRPCSETGSTSEHIIEKRFVVKTYGTVMEM